MTRKKKKRRLTKQGKIVFGCLFVLLISVLIVGVFKQTTSSTKENQEPLFSSNTPAIEEERETLSKKYDEIYEKYHELNSDYIGILEFKNGLLYSEENSEDNYPGLIVKSHIIEDNQGDVNAANVEYLRNDITHASNDIGQEFMDGSNKLDENNLPTDQNIIIYGHLVYRDHNLKFGPLHAFENQDNYEKYDTFTLTMNHEQRTYVVTDAFFYDKNVFNGIREESPFSPTYTKDELNSYMDKVKNEYENTLDTGITIDDTDNFVTLQTCVENRDDLLYIVLAKEIKRESFE